MSNIVYVLTNPAMPGIVKIGVTGQAEVQTRMGELYSTGVPLPFDCVVAREIEGIDAGEIERALHTAFDPHRINPSREFFQLEPEQVEVLLGFIPGKDVTPPATEQSADPPTDDMVASSKFKSHQSRTNEQDFFNTLNENGKTVYERVLEIGKRRGMRIKWGSSSFTLNVMSMGTPVNLCVGYSPSAFDQNMYINFPSVRQKTNVPDEAVETLREDALNTSLFEPAGKGDNLVCRTGRTWKDSELDALTGWLNTAIERIRQYETGRPNQAAG